MWNNLLCNGEVNCDDGKDESFRICGELTTMILVTNQIHQSEGLIMTTFVDLASSSLFL